MIARPFLFMVVFGVSAATAADPVPAPKGVELPVKQIVPFDTRGVVFALTPSDLGQYLTAEQFDRPKLKESLTESGAVWVSHGPVQVVHEMDLKTRDGHFALVRPLTGPLAGKLVAIERRFARDAVTTQMTSYPQTRFESYRITLNFPRQTSYPHVIDDTYLPPVVGWSFRGDTTGGSGPVYVHGHMRSGSWVNPYWRSR